MKSRPVPPGIGCASVLPGFDFADAHAVDAPPGVNAIEAAQRAFARSPRWIRTLLEWRNRLVAVFGLKPVPAQGFPIICQSPREVLNDRTNLIVRDRRERGDRVFSHIFVGVGDFEKAFGFYSAVMQILGAELRFCEPEKPWAGWHSDGKSRPLFIIGRPYDERPHDPGNGQMIAFAAQDRATVRRTYEAALAHGGTCDGPPGLRPHYHADYYGAYFRDPDGDKLCVASHGPQAGDRQGIAL